MKSSYDLAFWGIETEEGLIIMALLVKLYHCTYSEAVAGLARKSTRKVIGHFQSSLIQVKLHMHTNVKCSRLVELYVNVTFENSTWNVE